MAPRTRRQAMADRKGKGIMIEEEEPQRTDRAEEPRSPDRESLASIMQPHEDLVRPMYICICMYIYMYICICMYVYLCMQMRKTLICHITPIYYIYIYIYMRKMQIIWHMRVSLIFAPYGTITCGGPTFH